MLNVIVTIMTILVPSLPQHYSPIAPERCETIRGALPRYFGKMDDICAAHKARQQSLSHAINNVVNEIAQLVKISIVNGVCKRTYNWGGAHSMKTVDIQVHGYLYLVKPSYYVQVNGFFLA